MEECGGGGGPEVGDSEREGVFELWESVCVADSVFVWFSSTVVLAVTIYSTTSLVGIVNIDMTNLTIGYVGFTLITYLVTLYIWFVFP